MWVVRRLVVLPARWLYGSVLAPLGRGLAAGAAWVVRYLVVVPVVALGAALVWVAKALFWWPWVALWRYVLVPSARAVWTALTWLARVLVAVPARALHRWVLTPVGRVLAVVARETVDAFGHAWRAAGRISRAVWGLLARVLRWLFVAPVVWVWRHVVRPVGHAVRDLVWRPTARTARAAWRQTRAALAAARISVRQTRAEIRRALFGAPRTPDRAREVGQQPEPVDPWRRSPDRREPSGDGRVPRSG